MFIKRAASAVSIVATIFISIMLMFNLNYNMCKNYTIIGLLTIVFSLIIYSLLRYKLQLWFISQRIKKIKNKLKEKRPNKLFSN